MSQNHTKKINYHGKILLFIISVFLFTCASIFCSTGQTYAALINASNMLGHYDSDGNPQYNVIALPPSARGLISPTTSCVDTTNHRLFVADQYSSRISIFALGSDNNISTTTAAYVLGQNNFTAYEPSLSQNSMFWPYGVACDTQNSRLFVSDQNNNRILVFDVATITNGMNASYVIGQTDFISNAANTTQGGLNAPEAITYDPTNTRLFVADSGNNRVMVFNVPTGTNLTGENAAYVLGQANFTDNGSDTTASTMSGPFGAAYDPTNTRLFVADSGNNRVMVFNVPTGTNLTGTSSVYFLGQTSSTGGGSGITAARMNYPSGATYDSVNARLFVTDQTNNRVTVFNVPTATNLTGTSSVYFLGQTSSTAKISTTTQSGLSMPTDAGYDSTARRLFVADTWNNRIMVFNVPTGTNLTGENAAYELGHTDLNGNTQYTARGTNNNPNPQSAYNIHGAVLDTKNHRIFVSDYSDDNPGGRILVYPLDANNHISANAASYVIGWKDFYSYSQAAHTADKFEKVVIVSAYDSTNERLFVVDTNNNRVMIFDVNPATITNGENATYVLGQSSMTGNAIATTQSGLNKPRGAAYDPTNTRLFVADSGNNRVMVFNVPTGTNLTGENAAYVLGQNDFISSGAATTQNGLNCPQVMPYMQNMDYDSVNSRLFVPDMNNNRVMIFNVPIGTNLTGENAAYVIGQSNFTSSAAATTQNGFNYPNGVTYDSTANRLFVADYTNRRIMVFLVPIGINLNDINAQNVLNQSTFTTTANGSYSQYGSGGSQSGSYDPVTNIYFDAQYYPDRVMEFRMVHITTSSLPGAVAGTPYSQAIGISQNQGANQTFSVYSGTIPQGLSLNASTGAVTGTPIVGGTANFTIEADDNFDTGPFFDRKNYSFSIDPDIVAPSISLTSPSPGASISSIASLTASASDNALISGVKFYYNTTHLIQAEDTTSPYGTTWNTTALTDGAYSLIAVARDASGNYATSTPVSVTVDNTLPSGYAVSIDQSDINSGNNTAVSFTFSNAETGTTFNYSINDSDSSTSAITGSGTITSANQQVSNINVSSLTDGTLTLTAYLTDLAGNQGANATATVVKNRTTSPSGGGSSGSSSSSNSSNNQNTNTNNNQQNQNTDNTNQNANDNNNQNADNSQDQNASNSNNQNQNPAPLKPYDFSSTPLIRLANSPDIFALSNGTKRKIRSQAVFNSYNWDKDKILPTSLKYFNSLAEAVLIKTPDNPNVYIFSHGFKRLLASIETFNSYQLDWARIALVNQIEIDSYQNAPLIKHGFDIYWLDNNRILHLFPSTEILVGHGFNVRDAVEVNDTEFAGYGVGEGMD